MRTWCISCRIPRQNGECEHFPMPAPPASSRPPKPVDLTSRIKAITTCPCQCHLVALAAYTVVRCGKCCRSMHEIDSIGLDVAIKRTHDLNRTIWRLDDQGTWLSSGAWMAKVPATGGRYQRHDKSLDEHLEMLGPLPGHLVKDAGTTTSRSGDTILRVFEIASGGKIERRYIDDGFYDLLKPFEIRMLEEDDKHSGIIVGLRDGEIRSAVARRLDPKDTP